MRRSTCLVALAALAALAAQVPAQADNSQQAKMTSCNADASAKQLSGEDRKAFMSKCLSKGSTATTGNSQQEKMKTCNTEANGKSLKGDERKSFMSTCLKAGSGNSVH
jgi:hypothetical protein